MLGEIDKRGIATTGWTPKPPPATANQLADLCGLVSAVTRQRRKLGAIGMVASAATDDVLREIGVPCLQEPIDRLCSIAREQARQLRASAAAEDDGA